MPKAGFDDLTAVLKPSQPQHLSKPNQQVNHHNKSPTFFSNISQHVLLQNHPRSQHLRWNSSRPGRSGCRYVSTIVHRETCTDHITFRDGK